MKPDITTQLEQLRRAHEAGLLDDDVYLEMVAKTQANQHTEVISGAAAIGTEAKAVAEKGVLVGGSVQGNIVTGTQYIWNHYQNAEGQPLYDEANFKQALNRYLTWVERNFGRLDLRGIQDQEQQNPTLSVGDIYISLQVQMLVDPRRQGRLISKRSQSKLSDIHELLELSKRLVIIGGPGSGKTTYLRLIATMLAYALRTGDVQSVKETLGLTEELPLPIVASLGEFNLYRRMDSQPNDPRQGTLVAFLSYSLIRQQNIGLPADFLERLLQTKQKCVLLLDGLDEIVEVQDRWLVRQAVEDLADNEDIDRVIVTSRSRAYQGRAILPAPFRLVEVQPMVPEQVNALVERWCSAVYEPGVAKTESDDLIRAIAELEAKRQSRGENWLISTPLLTTIVAIVHYNYRSLPRFRATLYEKCIDVLLAEKHKPDRSAFHDLAVRGGTPQDKRNWLAYVAFQMIRAEEKSTLSVSEEQLNQWLLAAMVNRLGEQKAKEQAADFVQTMQERGSLLLEHEGTYQFSHQTFQEFLAAYYLAETVRQMDKIMAVLVNEERLAQGWWHETILLVASHLGERSDAAALEFVEGLLTYSNEDKVGLAAAELAAIAFLELNGQDQRVAGMVRERLIQRITDPALTASVELRALAGRALDRLVDTRAGVGVNPDTRLPDILWGGVVPSGSYRVGGDPIGGELNAHEYLVSRNYQLACFPVTYAQFACFERADDFSDLRWWKGMPNIEEKSQSHSHKLMEISVQEEKYGNHPRVQVSWYQAIAFCRWLSDKTGDDIDLPHEFEWEVAARYPDGSFFPWGNEFEPVLVNKGENGLGHTTYEPSDTDKNQRANSGENGLNHTTAVGIFPLGRNEMLRLYDLSGNVWEWCRNKYSDPSDAAVDYSDSVRSSRGGSWSNLQNRVRAAHRSSDFRPGDAQYNRIGFRLIRRLKD